MGYGIKKLQSSALVRGLNARACASAFKFKRGKLEKA